MGNFGLYFYRHYYAKSGRHVFDPRKFGNEGQHAIDEKNKEFFLEKNKVFFDYDFSPSDSKSFEDFGAVNEYSLQQFRLTTIYPGLLIGSGYAHETGTQEEFKLGFFFDHMTGLPIIPGSSVKGALRAVFPKCPIKNELQIDWDQQAETVPARSRAAFIWNECAKLKIPGFQTVKEGELLSKDNVENIHELEYEIFEGVKWENGGPSGFLDTYHRDIFFGAFIASKKHEVGRTSMHIFGKDFITPHKHPTNHELDQFANPIPIQFLKLLPNVVLKFNFKLQQSKVLPHLNAPNKAKLFRSILLTLGIGAKTRVGYGQFDDEDLAG